MATRAELESENAELRRQLDAQRRPACRGNPAHVGVPLDVQTGYCRSCFRTALGLPAPHDFTPDRE